MNCQSLGKSRSSSSNLIADRRVGTQREAAGTHGGLSSHPYKRDVVHIVSMESIWLNCLFWVATTLDTDVYINQDPKTSKEF